MQASTPIQVAAIIHSFINGTCGPHDWDNFIFGGPIADSELEAVRIRCASLPIEFPPLQITHYCSDAGIQVLRDYVQLLRSQAGEA